jgi:membrane-associated protease RseP (regulator of RpoE activity)
VAPDPVPNPALLAPAEEPAEPEDSGPKKPVHLAKTKVEFDKAKYTERIKLLSSQGKNVSKYEAQMKKIDGDINAGKHHYEVEQEIQELGQEIGLLKIVIPDEEPGSSSDDPDVMTTAKDSGRRSTKKSDRPSSGAYSDAGFGVGLRGPQPRSEAEFSAYYAATVSNAMPAVVKEIAPGGSAAAAGLKLGDRILTIDGDSTEGMTMSLIRGKLIGPENSTVSIGFQSASGQMRSVDLVRSTKALMRQL